MTTHTIVILCENAHDAHVAAEVIGTANSAERLFVLPAQEQPSDFTWLGATDIKIEIPSIKPSADKLAWSQDSQCMTRAGLLYASGDTILYCWANDPPPRSEVALAHEAFACGEGYFEGYRVWGYTREALIFDYQLESVRTPSLDEVKDWRTQLPPREMAPVSNVELSRAMMGLPVSDATLIAAVMEVVPMDRVEYDLRLHGRYGSLMMQIGREGEIFDIDTPKTIFVNVSNGSFPHMVGMDWVKTAGERIPADGAVVFATDEEHWPADHPMQPFQTFVLERPQGAGWLHCFNKPKE